MNQLCEYVEQAEVIIAEKQDKESGNAEAHKQPEECPDMKQLKNLLIEVLLEMQMPTDDGTNGLIFFKYWCATDKSLTSLQHPLGPSKNVKVRQVRPLRIIIVISNLKMELVNG